MAIKVLDEGDVARLIREAHERPEYVHQKNVEQHVGLPARDYLRLAREEAFPSVKVRRKVLARTTDVLAWLDLELRVRGGETPAANDADPEAVALASVGARRVSR